MSSSSSSANEVAHTVLGVLGNIASCLFFMSSLPTIVSMVRCKSSGGLSGDLYLLKLFNCMLWCLYGLPYVHPHDLWVWLTNAFGCAFALVYILTYFLYTTTKDKVRLLWKLSSILTSFAIMVVLLVFLSRSRSQRISVVGTLSSIVSSGMHIALLSQYRKAMQSGDSAFLHPCASMAGFVKGAIWSTYGLVSFDIFILVPNGVGVLIGIIQTMLLLFFIKKRAPSVCNVQDCEDGHQAQPKISMEAQTDHMTKQNDQDGVDSSSRRPRLSWSNVSRVPSFMGIPGQGHQALSRVSMEAQTNHTAKQNDQDVVDSSSRRPRLSWSNVSRVPSFMGIPGQGHQALSRVSMEVQTNHTAQQNDQDGVDSSSRRPRLSWSNVSRVPSFLGIPRQGSISSSVIIPITLDDK